MSARDSQLPRAPVSFGTAPLLTTTLITLVFVVVAYLQVPWVLIPLGLFVLFVAPGYATVALLFGERPLGSLALNIALIVGFSVFFNVVVGTALLAFRIGPLTPIVGLSAATICTAATIVQLERPPSARSGQGMRRIRSLLGLPGFTPGQRTAAYALFIGILLTFGAIGYLSTLQPGAAPDLALGVVGPDGTTGTLPTAGALNSTLAVIVEVGNNATPQLLVLLVNSSLVGESGTSPTTIPWVMPLQLAPNVTSSETLNLTSGETDNVHVSFQFGSGGDYALSFSLTPPQSHVAVRTSSITVRIT